jgi:hypothetical protein
MAQPWCLANADVIFQNTQAKAANSRDDPTVCCHSLHRPEMTDAFQEYAG